MLYIHIDRVDDEVDENTVSIAMESSEKVSLSDCDVLKLSSSLQAHRHTADIAASIMYGINLFIHYITQEYVEYCLRATVIDTETAVSNVGMPNTEKI